MIFTPEEKASAEVLVRKMLECIEGSTADREGLIDTPRRVVKSWSEIFAGYSQDPAAILKTTFKQEGYKVDSMILCKGIEIYSTCEHHCLPFFGTAHVAYIPSNRIVGLSKLARLVDAFARRLQVQEKLTNQIADALVMHLDPIGAAVVVDCKHHCMCSRGVAKQHSSMITSALRGVFMTSQSAREEFMSLIK